MPTSIGHAIAGAAAAWTADLVPGDRAWRTASASASWYRRSGNGLTLACAALAALPDVDLLFHAHRTYTHSIGAVIAVGLIAAAVAGIAGRPVLRVSLMCAAAIGTHLLLDYLAVDPMPPFGIQALWPFTHGWYISGWNVFLETERLHFLTLPTIALNARAIVREALILLPIAAIVWTLRRRALGRATVGLKPDPTGFGRGRR